MNTRTPLSVLALAITLAGCRAPAGTTTSPGAGRARRPDTRFLERYAATYRYSLGTPTSFQFTPEGDSLLFLRSRGDNLVRQLYAWDTASGRERVLLTAEQLLQGGAETLSPEERARRERLRLTARGITSFQLTRDGTRILVPLSGRLFVVERASGGVRELPAASGPLSEARFAPNGLHVGAVQDGDLYALDLSGYAQWRRLTTRAAPTITHGVAEFVAQEEMGRMEGYWFAPDGQTLAYQETDETGVEQLAVTDPTHPERAPELHAYPRAGHPNAVVRLGLMPVAGGATTWVEWDRARYPYLAKVVWPDRGPLTLLVQNREQTEEVLLAATPDGHTRVLLTETDAAWLNIDPAMPRWLPFGDEFLWSTERDGHLALEVRTADGALARTLTTPEMNYRGLLALDGEARVAWISGGAEPSESRVLRVPLGGGAPEDRTPGHGEFAAVVARHGGNYLLAGATLTEATRWTVHRADGTTIGEVRSEAESPGSPPGLNS